MPIERLQRPLRDDERQALVGFAAQRTPERLAAEYRKEQCQNLAFLVFVLFLHASLVVLLWRAEIPLLLAIVGIGILCAILYWLAFENGQSTRKNYQPDKIKKNYDDLLSAIENNKKTVWQISASQCVSLDSGDDDLGAHWLFQTGERELLLLQAFNFDGFLDYPPSHFELDDNAPDPTARALSEDLIPAAHLLLPDGESWGDGVLEVRLPEFKHSAPLWALEDGDLFALSLAELLDNPLALLKTRTGNLWESS